MKYGGKNCGKSQVTDDENHRVNGCELYKDINAYDSDEKVDFKLIYSDEMEQIKKVINIILTMWDLGCGKNEIREP